MVVAALLTGRGNNTLQNKNILDILGKPVLYYPAMAGVNSECVDYRYVSSDDEKILSLSETLGYKRIKRPDELSLSTSQHIEAIHHAIDIINGEGIYPDIIVVILANNITIESKWIDCCIDIMKNDMSLSSVVPVYKDNDHHPYRAKRITKEGLIETFTDVASDKISTNRQDLESSYYLCHNFWVINVKTLLNKEYGQPPWSFMGNRVFPYIVDGSIDIHTEFDLRVAAEWLSINKDSLKN